MKSHYNGFFQVFQISQPFKTFTLRERDLIEENEAFEEKEALGFIILRTKQKNLYLSFEELNESKRKKKI